MVRFMKIRPPEKRLLLLNEYTTNRLFRQCKEGAGRAKSEEMRRIELSSMYEQSDGLCCALKRVFAKLTRTYRENRQCMSALMC